MDKLYRGGAAVLLAAATSVSLSAFGIGDILGGGIAEREYTLADLGLGFLTTTSGTLASISGLGGLDTLAGHNAGRLKQELANIDAQAFFSEYDVVGKIAIKYNQVGMEQLDRLLREGTRATAATAIGRKLVSRVTANLIKLNQGAALGAELSAAEEDVQNTDEELQAAVRDKILAKLKEKKDKIDAKFRQALVRMHIAALAASIAEQNADQARTQAGSASGGAMSELAQLPSKFISNPLEFAKLPGIIDGAQRMVENVNKLSQDLPAFRKNCAVLRLALGELAAPAEEASPSPGQMQPPTTEYPEKK